MPSLKPLSLKTEITMSEELNQIPSEKPNVEASIRFDSLGLDPQLVSGLHSIGFTECTPIQAQTLPLTLNAKDVAGQAQTGTGKTAAFLIASIQTLLSKPANPERKANDPRALIIAPTRELAIQIEKDFLDISKTIPLKSVLVYGGTGIVTQKEAIIKGVDILIGTPGRIIDYYKQGVFSLKYLDVMVLDEADRMFDLGFIQDIRYLYKQMPAPGKRLTLMFSATFSQRVLELAYEHMHEPEFMRIETDSVTAENITQKIFFPSKEQKKPLLIQQFKELDKNARVIVFINTKREGEHLGATLQANGFNAQVFSGDVKQSRRQSMLAEFRSGKLPILIATDVAARGLHVPDVTHVFNYDLPNNCEDYVHRIGRTARAGASGHAISFGCDEYVMVLPDIEEYIGFKIPVEAELPSLPEIKTVARPQRSDRKSRDSKSRDSKRGARNAKPSERSTYKKPEPENTNAAFDEAENEYYKNHDDSDTQKQREFHADRIEQARRDEQAKREHKLRQKRTIKVEEQAPQSKRRQAIYVTPKLLDRSESQSAI